MNVSFAEQSYYSGLFVRCPLHDQYPIREHTVNARHPIQIVSGIPRHRHNPATEITEDAVHEPALPIFPIYVALVTSPPASFARAVADACRIP